jgi:integrase
MCTHLDKTGSTYYFRRPVPKDLVGYFTTATGKPRIEWKFSLRTKDREEAKRLVRPHVSETDKLIDDTRRALRENITQDRLAGAAERVEATSAAQEQAEAAAAIEADRQARYEARKEYRVAARQRMMLSTAELSSDEAAWRDLVREQGQELAKLRQAAAGQQESNERLAERMGKPVDEKPGLKLLSLFDRYAQLGAANPKTVRKWRSRVESLIAHLGHEDAGRVTRAELNAWIASLVAKGLAKKTIVDGYLPAVRAALAIAHDDGLISANPASGLKVRAPKPVRLRERDLTDDEAKLILRAALGPQPAGLAEKNALARRWVPWLCAYTGARVGEITQLRAMDIRQEEGVWVAHITPEAGPIKTYEARSVPLHPHLIEQGIVKLAHAGDAAPLFYNEGTGNAVNPASKIRAADLAKWVRTLGVTAPQPNHGWRHRFKTVTRAVGIPEHVADRIQGHTPRNAGGKYGFVPLATLRDAIDRIPRYETGRPAEGAGQAA